MVGVGGFYNFSRLPDTNANTGRDFQRLTSFDGQTQWLDDETFLHFQHIESDVLIYTGYAKLFLPVPFSPYGYTCKGITVGFEKRFQNDKTKVEINVWERRKDNNFYLMKNYSFMGYMTGAYYVGMNYAMEEGATIWIEIASLDRYNLVGIEVNGFSAVAHFTPGLTTTTIVNPSFVSVGTYPDMETALASGVLSGQIFTFDSESLSGPHGAVIYAGSTVNAFVKGFFATREAAAAALPLGSLYALKDSLLGADGKVMIVGQPSVNPTSIVRGYYVDNDEAIAEGLQPGELYALNSDSLLDVESSVYQVL